MVRSAGAVVSILIALGAGALLEYAVILMLLKGRRMPLMSLYNTQQNIEASLRTTRRQGRVKTQVLVLIKYMIMMLARCSLRRASRWTWRTKRGRRWR